ncbi:MAG TPA: DUF1003 domain-containing protein [Gaiellales bacterium]|nr:DUF1003 domain-containing protein [Gaiellales bacterium]
MAETAKPPEHLRFHAPYAHLLRPFGPGGFGAVAERIARFFGTPYYLIGQTAIVAAWILVNATHLVRFDLYPFILLNLAFSLQAAYAAPLILLAQTRQADRDRVMSDADARHREALTKQLRDLLELNTHLTEQIDELTKEIHGTVVRPEEGGRR